LIYFSWDIYRDPPSTKKILGGFLPLKATAGCPISTLIFEFSFVEGGLYEYPMTNILRMAKFLLTGNFYQRY
jgi:hypothetical protein